MPFQGSRSGADDVGQYYAHRGGRKGFNRNGGVICKECFQKGLEIEKLKEEIKRLKQQVSQARKKALSEGAFGTSTPSSKIPVKRNSTEEDREKRGGARLGHRGHGRSSVNEKEADRIVDLGKASQSHCPDCQLKLHSRGMKRRTVIEVTPRETERVLYQYRQSVCPGCSKTVIQKPPGVFPKSLYGNGLLSQAAMLHYIYGVSLGKVIRLFDGKVTEGGLVQAFHRMGQIFEKAIPRLIEEYRESPVKHADETGWRTDGKGGYVWIFCTDKGSIYRFGQRRASSVALEVIGHERVPGVLVVDRCPAYNQMPCEIQYCFAHLHRQVKTLKEEFSENREVQRFTEQVIPLLKESMGLRTQPIADSKYYDRAKALKNELQTIMNRPGKHPGVTQIQNIFVTKEPRLYHWVRDRRVPTENNAAEREARIPVLARKISFGSQSEQGARTRSAIMTYLFTAKKRLKPSQSIDHWLLSTLNQLAKNPSTDVYTLLPEAEMSTLPN